MADKRFPVAMELRFYGIKQNHGSAELSDDRDEMWEKNTERIFYFKDSTHAILNLEHRAGAEGMQKAIENGDYVGKSSVEAILTKYWPTGSAISSIDIKVLWFDANGLGPFTTVTRVADEVNAILEVMKSRGWKDDLSIHCFLYQNDQKKRIAEKKPESKVRKGDQMDDDESDGPRDSGGKQIDPQTPQKPGARKKITAELKGKAAAKKTRAPRKPTAAGNRGKRLYGRGNVDDLENEDMNSHGPFSIRSTSAAPSVTDSTHSEVEADTFNKGQRSRRQREEESRLQALDVGEDPDTGFTPSTRQHDPKVYPRTPVPGQRAPNAKPQPNKHPTSKESLGALKLQRKPDGRRTLSSLEMLEENEDVYREFFQADEDPEMVADFQASLREQGLQRAEEEDRRLRFRQIEAEAQRTPSEASAVLRTSKYYRDQSEEEDEEVEEDENDVFFSAKRGKLGLKKASAVRKSAKPAVDDRGRQKRAQSANSDDEEMDEKSASKRVKLAKNLPTQEIRKGSRVKKAKSEK